MTSASASRWQGQAARALVDRTQRRALTIAPHFLEVDLDGVCARACVVCFHSFSVKFKFLK